MAKGVMGRFYFKRTVNRNLIGEWSNNHEPRTFSESCDLAKARGGGYVGDYYSTWQENRKPVFAILTIDKEHNGELFHLVWKDTNETVIFKGCGMLCQDVLIGD